MSWKTGEPVPQSTQERLRTLIKERGEKGAATLLGITKTSLLRAAAGVGVRKMTSIAIEAQLKELKQ